MWLYDWRREGIRVDGSWRENEVWMYMTGGEKEYV